MGQDLGLGRRGPYLGLGSEGMQDLELIIYFGGKLPWVSGSRVQVHMISLELRTSGSHSRSGHLHDHHDL